MRPTIFCLAALTIVATAAAAGAQPKTEAPSNTANGNGTLSEKLGRTNGVIRPQQDIDPGIAKTAPVPNPDSTPVIPPPGSPGGNPQVQPK